MSESRFNQAHVRFSNEEYSKVLDVATAYALSVPEALKHAFFERMPARPLFHPEDARLILVGLSRLAKLLTHVAQILNSGYRGAFKAEIDEIRREITKLGNFVSGLNTAAVAGER